MEPITLCGLVIVMFGLWVEFSPAVMTVLRAVRNSRIYKELFSQARVQAVYDGKMVACFAKSHS